jgi:SAM-dependent methyltransferase
MRRVSSLPYRDFYYPLNVFMHILTHEEGDVTYLHYGLFTHPDERIQSAQERSTEMLVSRLPPPPARLLDVGVGLGTTLHRLTSLGYDVTGISPDDKQIAMVAARYGDTVRAECVRYEDYDGGAVDTILFQESAQYIGSDAIFSRARTLAPHVVVLDEFALEPLEMEGALHSRAGFLEAADRHGFRLIEEIDLSDQAAPTIDYFNIRLPRYREPLVADLGLTNEQVDDLIASGHRYRQLYRDGTYGYRLMQFRA